MINYFSIKSQTRAALMRERCRESSNVSEFVPTLESPLPPLPVSLYVTEKKVHHITCITENIWEFIRKELCEHIFIVVSRPNDVPLKWTVNVNRSESYNNL